MRNDYSADPVKRNLQVEAKAHVTVQTWIDGGALGGRAFTAAGICEVHKRFCDLLPEELLWAENPGTGDACQILAIPAPLVILGPSPRMTRGAGIAEASFAR